MQVYIISQYHSFTAVHKLSFIRHGCSMNLATERIFKYNISLGNHVSGH